MTLPTWTFRQCSDTVCSRLQKVTFIPLRICTFALDKLYKLHTFNRKERTGINSDSFDPFWTSSFFYFRT